MPLRGHPWLPRPISPAATESQLQALPQLPPLRGTSGHYKGMPFGGFKNSGIGREGGLDELLSYTEEKAIHVML
jgi:hypothetical protein